MSQSILARVRQKAAQNSYLAKMASEDAPVEEVKQESVATGEPATAMVEGTAGVPDVTENNNTNDFASIGEHVESAVNAEETTAAETIKNEDNPDVQEILAAKDTVIKTANALYQQACIIRDMPLANLESLFNKTASAVEMSDEALFGMIEKSAAAGNVVAQGYVQFCQGMMMGLSKIANDAEALVAQGVPPEEAEAMAAEALANDLAVAEAAPTDAETTPEDAETAPADAEAPQATEEEIAEAVGAEAEAAAAELATEAAKTIMEMDPAIAPEEAQALGEQLVAKAIQEGLTEEPAPSMEQTASAEEMVAEEAAGENFEEALLDAAAELSESAVPEIMALDPSLTEEQAAEIADELVAARVAEVFGGAGAAEMPAETPAGAEEVVTNEMVAEAEQVVDEVIAATAEEIKAASPEISDEAAIMAAEEAVADAMDTLQEQAAIGATDESGAFVVPDDVAAASVEDMVKTASDNPLRDTLTPTFAQLFGIDQSAFIKRVTR